MDKKDKNGAADSSLEQESKADSPKGSAATATIPQQGTSSFAFTDFSLFRHFVKATAFEHADDKASLLVWCEAVSDLATQYPYLLHEVLAVAALHLRTTCPEQAEGLEQVAAEHQARAIPLFRTALAACSAETVMPLFACSCLIIPYHFASARDPLSLLLNEETSAPPEWLVLMEGCAAITMGHGHAIFQSPLGALLGDLFTPDLDDLGPFPADSILLNLKTKLPYPPEHKASYTRMVDRLRISFSLSERATSMLDRKNAALRFPPNNGAVFKEDLGMRRPAALVLMGFWCILLHRVEDRWWLKGRVEPLLLKIEELLTPEYRHLIAYPLGELGLRRSDTESVEMQS